MLFDHWFGRNKTKKVLGKTTFNFKVYSTHTVEIEARAQQTNKSLMNPKIVKIHSLQGFSNSAFTH